VHQNGVTAMHDATEGGVIAATFELAHASGLGAELDLPAIPISPETSEICKVFRIDPLNSLSEGSLLIACRPSRTGRITGKLRQHGIVCEAIGRLTRKRILFGVDSKGTKRKMGYPKFDPYWRAYWKATSKRWK